MEAATAAETLPRRPPRPPGIVVFGGGTATNSLVDVFERIREQRGSSLSYIIPISDNGGSSSELIRMFGGPGAYYPSTVPVSSRLPLLYGGDNLYLDILFMLTLQPE